MCQTNGYAEIAGRGGCLTPELLTRYDSDLGQSLFLSRNLGAYLPLLPFS